MQAPHFAADGVAFSSNPALILLYGPPCSGKTECCERALSSAQYERLSTREALHQRGAATSLHRLLGELASRVSQRVAGTSILLDDPHELSRTRASVITAIRSRVPSAAIAALICLPRGGMAQARWAFEFALAERTLLLAPDGTVAAPAPPHHHYFDESEASRLLAEWDVIARAPSLDEGFSEVRVLHTDLSVSGGPHTAPALIVELGALVAARTNAADDSHSALPVHPLPLVATALRSWADAAGDGARVIVLAAEGVWMPVGLAADRADPELLALRLQHLRFLIRGVLGALAAHARLPVYYLSALYGSERTLGDFAPPGLGMLAWAQRRHRLQLSRCLYVSERPEAPLLPHAGGLQHISAASLFAASGWDLDSKLRKYGTCEHEGLPQFVRAIRVHPSPPSAPVPFRETDDLLPLQAHWGRCVSAVAAGAEVVCEEHGGPGRLHGLQLPPDMALVLPQQHSMHHQQRGRERETSEEEDISHSLRSPKDASKRSKQHHPVASPPPSPPERRPATVAEAVAQHLKNRSTESLHSSAVPSSSSSPAPPKVSLREQLQQLPPP